MHYTSILGVLSLAVLVQSTGTRGHIGLGSHSTNISSVVEAYWDIGLWVDSTSTNWMANITAFGAGQSISIDWNVDCVVEYWCGHLYETHSEMSSYKHTVTKGIPLGSEVVTTPCDNTKKDPEWGVVQVFSYCCPDGFVYNTDDPHECSSGNYVSGATSDY